MTPFDSSANASGTRFTVATSIASYVSSFFMWIWSVLSSSQFATFFSLILAGAGFVLTWYYNLYFRKRDDTRKQEEHDAYMLAMKNSQNFTQIQTVKSISDAKVSNDAVSEEDDSVHEVKIGAQ